MNSALVLQEEEQDGSISSASSIEVSVFPKYWTPHIPLARLGSATTSAVIIAVLEDAVYTCPITAPRVDFSGFYETSISTPKTKVVYENQKAVEALLGTKGRHILSRVIELIEGTSHKNDWPLTHVEVIHIDDTEVENWQYALVTLVFNSDFEVADEYLHNFYNELDSLADILDGEGQDILQRTLFFDAATAL